MAALVTTEEARVHLRLTDDDMLDADIAATVAFQMEAASEIVIDYIKQPDHGWVAADAPFLIKAAILLLIGYVFDDREGDENLVGLADMGQLPDSVRAILHRYRDPALR